MTNTIAALHTTRTTDFNENIARTQYRDGIEWALFVSRTQSLDYWMPMEYADCVLAVTADRVEFDLTGVWCRLDDFLVVPAYRVNVVDDGPVADTAVTNDASLPVWFRVFSAMMLVAGFFLTVF